MPKKLTGNGGETRQNAESHADVLTTNQGTPVSDNQNSLKIGPRGPTLLEDFVLREKITHFDHERIPERIVHARGSGAHGYFVPIKSAAHLTTAAFLQNPKEKTKVFVRFSTVAGGAGSVDTARDVRGFAVKFYTSEGNFDLVGNNIPVFFIQDAMKFPDLVHSVKMEPDRGFPQAASAHDTFWDFVSLMPESVHMLMWAMSDRAIPRSYRMMEGFGVNTFRMINSKGKVQFVKFHWRPTIGTTSLLWDEAVKIAGADPDYHRRDLWEAIDQGSFPEFTFGVQAVDEATANSFDFDILDPTKLIPEELVPIEILGKMVLNENPANFFAETEQVAFHPGHVVPGIDFSNDPLLQGRLHSYLDTQLSRLGGPNFHEIPINKPVCPMRNFQRDGQMRMAVPQGRVAYEPNSLSNPDGSHAPREDARTGFRSTPVEEAGQKLRVRPESFADHYSQPRLFWQSMTAPEQLHIVKAFTFELGKVATIAIRERMLGHLALIDSDLVGRVAKALRANIQKHKPAVAPRDPKVPSPALSIIENLPGTIKGRRVGILASDGTDAALLTQARKALEAEGASVALIASSAGGFKDSAGKHVAVDMAVNGGPSIFFDAVIAMPSKDGAADLSTEPSALDWLRDAFAHLKAIGHTPGASRLFEAAKVDMAADEGMVSLSNAGGIKKFIAAAKLHRIWAREKKI